MHYMYLYICHIYDGLSTLCHSSRFDYQHRLLKTLPDPRCLRYEDGMVQAWYLLSNELAETKENVKITQSKNHLESKPILLRIVY